MEPMKHRNRDEPQRYGSAEGRRFGLTVGTAFGVLAGLVYWRGRPTISLALGGFAAALLLGGILIPARLGPVERGWMAFARALSRVTTPVFMGIVYFVVLTPTGLVRRAFGRNSLARNAGAPSYWVTRDPPADPAVRRRRMERQF